MPEPRRQLGADIAPGWSNLLQLLVMAVVGWGLLIGAIFVIAAIL